MQTPFTPTPNNEDGSGEGGDDGVVADVTTGGDDSGRAASDEARGDGGEAQQ